MISNGEKKTARIALFLPIRRTFVYSYGPQDEKKLKPGVRVVAPFRNRDTIGVFVGFEKSDVKTKRIKFILDDKPVFPKTLVKLALWCASYYMCGIGEMFKNICPKESIKKRVTYRRGEINPKRPSEKASEVIDLLDKPYAAATLSTKAGLTQKELEKLIKPLVKSGVVVKSEEYYFAATKLDPLTWEEVELKSPTTGCTSAIEFSYTVEQDDAIGKISSEIDKMSGKVLLLHGITGSGKTAVYIELCREALKKGGSAMVLVPEIALTYQLVKRFYARFGRKIALMHSGLTPAQRRDEWMRLQKGEASIVIGARSAVFAPLDDLRLIVVDEEHDGSYKQNENPAYNARDVAVMLGSITGASVVLGSATPSMESYFNTQQGKYGLCELTHRIDNRPLPPVKCVKEVGDGGD
ncbi:MAG: primosomal protein N', partial [Nitrospinota bacterium]